MCAVFMTKKHILVALFNVNMWHMVEEYEISKKNLYVRQTLRGDRGSQKNDESPYKHVF